MLQVEFFVTVSQLCMSTEFSCGDGQCIPAYLKCNGESECANGADERMCRGKTFPGYGFKNNCLKMIFFLMMRSA